MMKNNYKKITSLILIILFTVLQFFSSYSYINDWITPQFYETNDDGILTIKRGKTKKFVDKEGKVLTEVNGEYSYLKKIYDIETKKLKYLVSDNIRYVDEEYYAGYSFYKNEDVKICTLDGIPISEFSEKHFNGDISICFSYRNYLIYVKEWHVLGNGLLHDTYSYINLFDIAKNADNKVFDEVLSKVERDDWRSASGIGGIKHIHFDVDNSLLKIYIKTGDYENNKDEDIKGREIGLSFNPLTKEVSKIDYVPYEKEEKKVEKNINPAFSSNIFALHDDNAKRNEMYSDKLKKLNIENYVDFSVDGDKIYVMAFTDKINTNSLLEEYGYDVYGEDGKIILKDLPICKKHTIIHMHVNYDDYWIKDLNTYSDEYSEHHWCIEDVAKMQMKNRYYYAYNKNKGLYDLKSYNGKVIFDNIDDYTVDGKFYDIYCFKKDGIWYLYDAFSNEIFAKNFDPNYVYWDILYLGEEKFIRFTMDDDKIALYDKNGKILMKNLVKCEPSNNKYFQVENSFNYGFIDKNGEWVVKYPAFDVIDD